MSVVLGVSQVLVAEILQSLCEDASPKGSTLSWGCVLRISPGLCWLSVPALGSGLLQARVAAALILSPLGLWLSRPAIALFELLLQFLPWNVAQGQPEDLASDS